MTSGRLRIAPEAESDILGIGEYTRDTWGWRQAARYLRQLEEGCSIIAGNPLIGRPSSWIRNGLRRFEIGKHVVFYIVEQDCVLIVRILHQRQIPTNYF